MYDDIIDIEYPFKLKHPRMSIYNRSSQFAPFAALTGHSESIKETARLTNQKIELDDDLKQIISNKLNFISKNNKNRLIVSITYFVKDKKKDGGKYITISEQIKKIDTYNKTINLVHDKRIPIEDIINIEII